MIPNILSIAGTDPTGGAGIHADLKSIAAAGGYGMAVVTSLVAQNTSGVQAIHTPPPEFLRAQLDAVSNDVRVDAVKIGMLGEPVTVRTIYDWLSKHRPRHVVLDPVMVTTSGHRLLTVDAERELMNLLEFATLVTPNIPELEVMANVSRETLKKLPDALAAAQELAGEYDVQIVVKAGHLDTKDAGNTLVSPEGVVASASSPRVATKNSHGTGCSLSSALATRLGHGDAPEDALQWATTWLHQALVHADELDVGHGSGPVHHFWNYAQ